MANTTEYFFVIPAELRKLLLLLLDWIELQRYSEIRAFQSILATDERFYQALYERDLSKDQEPSFRNLYRTAMAGNEELTTNEQLGQIVRNGWEQRLRQFHASDLFGYVDRNARTRAFTTAIARGNIGIVKFIVDSKIVDPIDIDYGHFQMVGISGNLEILNYLVSQVGRNVLIHLGQTLKFACINRHRGMVKYLVEKLRVPIITSNHEALAMAAESRDLDIVKYLVEHGADVRAQDSEALWRACMEGALDIVKYLLGQGADIHAGNDYPLRAAIRQLNVVEYLVEQGANIQAEDNAALQKAAELGVSDTVKFLVEHGADIHAGNDNALRNACANGHFAVVQFLVDRGANVNAVGAPNGTSLNSAVTAKW